jgi:hypothetical protein
MELVLHLDDLMELVQKPWVDGRDRVDLLKAHSTEYRIAQIPDAIGIGSG